MVRRGSPRTDARHYNSNIYPFALSVVEGLLRVFTQSVVRDDNAPGLSFRRIIGATLSFLANLLFSPVDIQKGVRPSVERRWGRSCQRNLINFNLDHCRSTIYSGCPAVGMEMQTKQEQAKKWFISPGMKPSGQKRN